MCSATRRAVPAPGTSHGGATCERRVDPGHRAATPDCATAPAAPEDEPESERTTVDDGFEAPAAPAGAAAPLPFADLSDAELAAKLRADIGALGPMSIGQAHGGVLIAGMQMPTGANWEVVSPGLAWGTKETVEGLAHAIDSVAARFPNTPKAFIGNISASRGGHLPPHVSHQSGRDVDLGYYLSEGHRWYATANASNLDRARTWHLVRTLIADSDIDLILMDLQVQKIMKAYARERSARTRRGSTRSSRPAARASARSSFTRRATPLIFTCASTARPLRSWGAARTARSSHAISSRRPRSSSRTPRSRARRSVTSRFVTR